MTKRFGGNTKKTDNILRIQNTEIKSNRFFNRNKIQNPDYIYDKLIKRFIFARTKGEILIGEMAERSNAAVLKTVEGHTSGGSNPSLSANKPVNI